MADVQSGSRACPRCKAENRPDAKWCSSCAQQLDQAPPASAQPTTQPAPQAAPKPMAAPAKPSPPTPASPRTQPPPARTAQPPRPAPEPTTRPGPAKPAATPRPEPARAVVTPTGTRPAPIRGREPVAADRRQRLLAIIVGVLLVTTVWFGIMAFTGRSVIVSTPATQATEAKAEVDIAAIGERFAQNLLTFDYRTIGTEIDDTLVDATDQFRGQFHQALNGDVEAFLNDVRQKQAESTGVVMAADLTSRDGSTAQVIVVVSQTVRNNASPAPRTRFQVLELTMVDTADGWKVDNVGVPSAAPA